MVEVEVEVEVRVEMRVGGEVEAKLEVGRVEQDPRWTVQISSSM